MNGGISTAPLRPHYLRPLCRDDAWPYCLALGLTWITRRLFGYLLLINYGCASIQRQKTAVKADPIISEKYTRSDSVATSSTSQHMPPIASTAVRGILNKIQTAKFSVTTVQTVLAALMKLAKATVPPRPSLNRRSYRLSLKAWLYSPSVPGGIAKRTTSSRLSQ